MDFFDSSLLGLLSASSTDFALLRTNILYRFTIGDGLSLENTSYKSKFFGYLLFLKMDNSSKKLHVKSKVHYITVLNNVVFAFYC